MEEIIHTFMQMWSEFWQDATGLEKLLSVLNLIGAAYTFVVSFILLHKLDDLEDRILDMNYIIAKIALSLVILGSFYSTLIVRVPTAIEFLLSAGLTLTLTHSLIMAYKGLAIKVLKKIKK